MLKSTHRWLLWCRTCDPFAGHGFELSEDDVFTKSRSRVTHCSKCKTKLKKREILRNVPTLEGKECQ